jgi:hypothetical protein
MRTMPTHIHADPFDDSPDAEMVEIPRLTRDGFLARLVAIAGRDLTESEISRVEKMSRHNWTLRVQATELFGAAVVDAHFAPSA